MRTITVFILCITGAFPALRSQHAFVPNKGQWASEVLYRAETTGGYVYLTTSGITVQLLEDGFYAKLHDWVQGTGGDTTGKAHALKIDFLGARINKDAEESGALSHVSNYFLGNDRSKWATQLSSYRQVLFSDVYSGVDLRCDVNNGILKYEYIVHAGADPTVIKTAVIGAESLRIDEGALLMQTSVGEYRELPPFAYQFSSEGDIIPVACSYILRDNEISYHFPNGYDVKTPLIIDPELEFSSYLGSVSSSFGFTACYDNDGSLYAGSIVFGANFPATPGAYQINFAGGTIDAGISKFSADGTQLIYNTYLGGSGNEAPHSIVTDSDHNLYIMGSTSSLFFPTTPGAFQTTFGGGFNTSGAGYQYSTGSDIFVSKLGPSGNQLIGSTLLGGSGNDGVSTGTALDFNYGDRFRGEIVVDSEGSPYIASVTNSTDFPIINGYSSTGTFELSGVVVKFDSALSQIAWSTYIGGSSPESAISIQLAPDNSLYVTGGTTSADLPVTAGAYQSALAGSVDGYIVHISSDGGTLLHCTYNGTNAFDLNFFVQLDLEGNVYVVGQSTGSYPVSQGVYNNPNSRQFVQKFTPDLSTSLWSTTIGSGSGQVDISPSAFLVSDCGQIYISGWGGAVNSAGGNTFGLPLTPDAFQSTTDGSDFYVMVLGVDAGDLAYATYFGGSQSSEHVDGGTSRFDKNGTVYQAVCAGCWANDDFPTQNGVVSQINPSVGCNLGVFKFRLGSVNAEAQINAPSLVCPGTAIDFENLSVDADIFLWDFGDGNISTETNPTYAYDTAGTFTVTLIASSSEGCLNPDSTSLEITIGEPPIINVEVPEIICPNQSAQLTASGASNWSWAPSTGLNNTNIANPVFSHTESITYTVTGSTSCGSSTLTVPVNVADLQVEITGDTEICPGSSSQLLVTGGATYAWTPESGLSSTVVANPVASPTSSTSYAVVVTTLDGCSTVETVTIQVLPPAPQLTGNDAYTICNGNPVQLNVSGYNQVQWWPIEYLSNPMANNPIASPPITTTYSVSASNICGSDSMEVTVFLSDVQVSVLVDEVVCFDTPFTMEAFGATSYQWEPADLVSDVDGKTTNSQIEQTTLFTLFGYNDAGCSDQLTFQVQTYPRVSLFAGRDQIIYQGDVVMIESNSPLPIIWENHPYISCQYCNYPYVNPPETTTYFASITTSDGCIQMDSVNIYVRGNIYVPNAFTPDGDGINDIFKAAGVDISEFRMEIYNRWGELVYASDDIQKGWNGAKLGTAYYVPADVYPYRVIAREKYGEYFELKGHVTLIR